MVGIARMDEDLIDLAFASIGDAETGPERLSSIIRDIDRIVIFMKASTSTNRTDPVIIRQVKTRDITVTHIGLFDPSVV